MPALTRVILAKCSTEDTSNGHEPSKGKDQWSPRGQLVESSGTMLSGTGCSFQGRPDVCVWIGINEIVCSQEDSGFVVWVSWCAETWSDCDWWTHSSIGLNMRISRYVLLDCSYKHRIVWFCCKYSISQDNFAVSVECCGVGLSQPAPPWHSCTKF